MYTLGHFLFILHCLYFIGSHPESLREYLSSGCGHLIEEITLPQLHELLFISRAPETHCYLITQSRCLLQSLELQLPQITGKPCVC